MEGQAMSTMTSAQRVGILVDVQNMFYSAYDCFRGRLNYKKLLDAVAGDRQVVRALAYAMRDGNNQSPFFTMLREVGFELRTKEPRTRPDGTRKGGWDIGIAIDALALAPRLDAIALVTGDGDFVDLVHALKAQGVRVDVFAFERNCGRELKEAADEFVAIGEEMIFRDGHVEAREEAVAAPREAPARGTPARGTPAREAPERETPAREAPAREAPARGRTSREESPQRRKVRSTFGAGILNNASGGGDDDDDDELADIDDI